MTAQSYFLARDVYFCTFPLWYVFLDLRRDRYFAVARAPLDELASSLLKCDLVTADPARGRPVAPTVFQAPGYDLGVGQWGARRSVPTRDAWRVLSAAMRVSRELKRHPLSEIITRLTTRRHALTPCPQTDLNALGHRMAEFHAVRPWFPREYRCLFDSLAALKYLAGFRLFPSLVFGVQAEPFEAHCWLQADDAVVNDSLDTVRAFSPILVV